MPPRSHIESPCIDICKLDANREYCIGCFRTRDDIARWGHADDHARRGILKRADARRRAAMPQPGPDGSR